MSNALIIVESPTKVKTIKKYLGTEFDVRASVGHVKDLPGNTLGIDIEHDFSPTYQVLEAKKKVITELKKAAKSARHDLSRPGPRSGGEAIAWHIAEEIGTKGKQVYRVLFNDLTKNTMLAAIKNPLPLNLSRYEAQQTQAHPRPAGGLPDQPHPLGQGEEGAFGRPRPVRRRANRLRA